MLLKLVVLFVAIQLTHSCIPLGLGANCNCQQNPSCGQCAPQLIPPVSQPCSTCSFSNDVQPQVFNSAPYVAPSLDPSQIPTANNQYPQPLSEPQQFSHQPVAIPIANVPEYHSQPPSDSAINNNYVNERDQQLRNAISEFNEKENVNVPFPGEPTPHHYATKRPNSASPPAAEPPSDDYAGLPAIYFTMRPNTQVTATNQPSTTTESNDDPYSNSLSSPQKANVSIQTTESTTSNYQSTPATNYQSTSATTETTTYATTTTTKPSTKAYAFASGTYWAVLEERETENGAVHQRRIPYHSYDQEVCTGATLGRSIEKDLESVAIKCTQIGCAAVNVRLIDSESNEFEAIYLKNVNSRRRIKANKTYTCISVVDVPAFEEVYEKREREIQKELENKANRRRMPITINQPPRLRFVNIEPKGIYN